MHQVCQSATQYKCSLGRLLCGNVLHCRTTRLEVKKAFAPRCFASILNKSSAKSHNFGLYPTFISSPDAHFLSLSPLVLFDESSTTLQTTQIIMPSLFRCLAIFAMGKSRLNTFQALRLFTPLFSLTETSQLPALFWRSLRVTAIVPTIAKTTTRPAASRTWENVSRRRPTTTSSVSAVRRASSGTRQRRFATTRPIGVNGKEIERRPDSSAKEGWVGVGLRRHPFWRQQTKGESWVRWDKESWVFEAYWPAGRSLGPLGVIVNILHLSSYTSSILAGEVVDEAMYRRNSSWDEDL